jgi:hypothetical protein
MFESNLPVNTQSRELHRCPKGGHVHHKSTDNKTMNDSVSEMRVSGALLGDCVCTAVQNPLDSHL